ncbi:MAG: hypothetical protein OXN17_09340 [Candidatus Poribacteria bacterium]|nr:hypothetical protein [Candidatus Poribacteria bacterium]
MQCVSYAAYCLRLLIFSAGVIAFSFFPVSAVTAAPDAVLQFDEWVNFTLEKMETDGVTGGFHRHTRPRTRRQIAEVIRRAQRRIADGTSRPPAITIELLEKLEREFAPELDRMSGQDDAGGFRARGAIQLRSTRDNSEIGPAYEGAFSYDAGGWMTFYQEFEVADFPEKYPLHGSTASKYLKPWRGDFTADFKRVFLRFPISRFEMLVGRDQLFWGTGFRGAVGISDESPPFNLILLTGRFGKIRGLSFTAQLDQIWHDEGPRRYLASRYLAGHRLDYQINDRVEVGVTELIVYGGESRRLEWVYFNPILPYYASQFNADEDDNVMFLFEGAVRPVDGFRLYGELLMDDVHYIKADDPNAIAWLGGLEWNRILESRRLGIRAEFARVNRWAYTHLIQEHQFTHFGSIIGHGIGVDADVNYVEGYYLINADTRVNLFIEMERQGEAGVEDRYTGEDFRSISFPSGTVERRHGFGFQLVYEPIRAWQLDVTYQHAYTVNKDSQDGMNQNSNHLEFQFRYLWERGF